MTRSEAATQALAHLNQLHKSADNDPIVLVQDATLDTNYGWVFFYQSKKYLETGSVQFLLAENRPLVVLHDGTIHTLPSAKSIDQALKLFEDSNHLA